MVKLRLRRAGCRKRPFFEIVAADSRSPRDGRFIELIGTYNPLLEENKVKLDLGKTNKWISYGAMPTQTVLSLIKKVQINEKKQ